MAGNRRVLLVISDPEQGRRIASGLKKTGFDVLGPAPTAYYALSLLGSRSTDFAFVDVRLDTPETTQLLAKLEGQGVDWWYAARAESQGDLRFTPERGLPTDYAAETLIRAFDEPSSGPVEQDIPASQDADDSAVGDGRYAMEQAILNALGSSRRSG
jgi:hypothetical protein